MSVAGRCGSPVGGSQRQLADPEGPAVAAADFPDRPVSRDSMVAPPLVLPPALPTLSSPRAILQQFASEEEEEGQQWLWTQPTDPSVPILLPMESLVVSLLFLDSSQDGVAAPSPRRDVTLCGQLGRAVAMARLAQIVQPRLALDRQSGSWGYEAGNDRWRHAEARRVDADSLFRSPFREGGCYTFVLTLMCARIGLLPHPRTTHPTQCEKLLLGAVDGREFDLFALVHRLTPVSGTALPFALFQCAVRARLFGRISRHYDFEPFLLSGAGGSPANLLSLSAGDPDALRFVWQTFERQDHRQLRATFSTFCRAPASVSGLAAFMTSRESLVFVLDQLVTGFYDVVQLVVTALRHPEAEILEIIISHPTVVNDLANALQGGEAKATKHCIVRELVQRGSPQLVDLLASPMQLADHYVESAASGAGDLVLTCSREMTDSLLQNGIVLWNVNPGPPRPTPTRPTPRHPNAPPDGQLLTFRASLAALAAAVSRANSLNRNAADQPQEESMVRGSS